MDSTSEKDTEKNPDEKPAVTLPATVEKIVPPVSPQSPEMAEIHIEGADHLYREIRVENKLTNESGEEVKLKQGSHVEVTIEADKNATVPKKTSASNKS
jgi:hypothetical protein